MHARCKIRTGGAGGGAGWRGQGCSFLTVFHFAETIYILLLYVHIIMPSLKYAQLRLYPVCSQQSYGLDFCINLMSKGKRPSIGLNSNVHGPLITRNTDFAL